MPQAQRRARSPARGTPRVTRLAPPPPGSSKRPVAAPAGDDDTEIPSFMPRTRRFLATLLRPQIDWINSMRSRRNLDGLRWPEAALFVVLHAVFVAADTWVTAALQLLGLALARMLNVLMVCMLARLFVGSRCDAEAVAASATIVLLFRWADGLVRYSMMLRGSYRAARPLLASLEDKLVTRIGDLPPWAGATLGLLAAVRQLLHNALLYLGIVMLLVKWLDQK
jgi:hypothetical protein